MIRKIGSPTILAEARAGRLVLGFERMVSLNMTPRSGQNPVTAGEKTAIGNSLIKIQPTLAQAFTCAIGTPSAPTNLNLLNLLGPTSLDIPLMPHHVLYAASPAIVTAADIMLGDPGPLGSIKSLMVDCDLSAAAYFTGSQSIAVCGKIGGVGDPLFTDFSSGADVSVGLSQNFAQPMLRELGSQIISDILDDDAKNKSIPGLDRNSLTANVTFQSNAVHVHVNGAGSVKGAFLFFDADFSFDLHTDIRMRAQKAVVQDLRDDPVHVGQLMSVAKDRFDCDIPAPVLKSFGLDISENKLDLPAPSAHQNPLSFLAYYDPGNGSAPHDGELAQRVPPPVYDAAGTEIVRPDQTNPPTGCGPDQPDRYGQKSFADPKLKPQWEVWALPPRKDDTRVDVHPSFWSYLLFIAAGILGSVAALLVPFIGFALSPMIAIATIVLLPFVHLIAGAIATPMVQDRVGKQNRPPIDLDTNVGSVLGLYIEDPTGPRQPVTIQDGALITRFHAVVQAAAFNEGFGGG